jgi:hypothetical protein
MTSIEIGGRQFVFVKPTIGIYIKLLKSDYQKQFSSLDFQKMIEDEAEYKRFKNLWRGFCLNIFEHSWLWYVKFPKQLRFDTITMQDIVRVVTSFFGSQAEIQKPQDEQKTDS